MSNLTPKEISDFFGIDLEKQLSGVAPEMSEQVVDLIRTLVRGMRDRINHEIRLAQNGDFVPPRDYKTGLLIPCRLYVDRKQLNQSAIEFLAETWCGWLAASSLTVGTLVRHDPDLLADVRRDLTRYNMPEGEVFIPPDTSEYPSVQYDPRSNLTAVEFFYRHWGDIARRGRLFGNKFKETDPLLYEHLKDDDRTTQMGPPPAFYWASDDTYWRLHKVTLPSSSCSV